jgi:PAS domain S-box-containing protein
MSPKPPAGTNKGDLSPLTVLLVDDVQENLELLEEVLQENGYVCVQAKNGVDALKVLEQDSVHLVVADAMMPKMDGFQLCKEVRALPASAKVPFIIYTGNYVDAADQEFARSIGVDRYVVKYAGLGALVQAVNELVDQRYGRRPDQHPHEPEHIDDQAFLEKHHAIVIKKLEEKMAELEMYAETLVRKNREIQASEERYRALFDHASIAIFVIDRATGRCLEVNREGLALLRYSREELLAMPRLPFVGKNEFTRSMLDAHNFISGETSITTQDGTTLDVDVGVGPVTRPQDARVMLYVRDITEQKKMREQLLQAEKMTLMGRLAAGIAHEIRNPLSAITLNLQYLVQKYEAEEPLRESVKDALEGAKRVETVIENTLNLARVTPPVLKQEQLNPLVDQVIGFVRISVQQKEIRIETLFAEGLPAVMVDAKQIQQVILNIVQNAIDASPAGAEVLISTERVADPRNVNAAARAAVTVRDHGPGISAEQRKHLFEQFRTTKAGGTGLGLALSKQIMDRHRGEIHIDPAPGGGTIVRILFPPPSAK